MSEGFFKEIPCANAPPDAMVPGSIPVTEISHGEIRLLQRVLNRLTDERATSCLLPDIFYSALQNNIPEDELEAWDSVIIAMNNDIHAEWVQNAIQDCYTFWDSSFINNYIYGFFKTQKVADDYIPKLSEQMLSYLPTVYQQEQSPRNYKLYKAICMQVALTGVNYPTYTFNNILSGGSLESMKEIFPKAPMAATHMQEQMSQSAELRDSGSTSERYPGKTDSTAGGAVYVQRTLNNSTPVQQNPATSQSKSDLQMQFEIKKWQLENEQLRNQERARRQQEYQQSILDGTIGQKSSIDTCSNPNLPVDFSPKIPPKLLLTIGHALVVLIVYFIEPTVGLYTAIALIIALTGWFRDRNGEPWYIPSLNIPFTPMLQSVIGYIAFIVILIIGFR